MTEVLLIASLAELQKEISRQELIDFIYNHLERFRDDRPSIGKALDYIFDPQPGKGGFILLAKDAERTLGALVMLKTGMSLFVPQNLLVYFAVQPAFRGQGLGSMMLEKAKSICEGDIALHAEPDNLARQLYDRQGFTVRYLEMRWRR